MAKEEEGDREAFFGLRRGTTLATMSALLTGITLFFLASRGYPVFAKALALRGNSGGGGDRNGGGDVSMCEGVLRACRHRVFEQIQCQVAQLNASARRLFETYLERQGPPFTEDPETFCAIDRRFPLFENGSKKEALVSLYKIFVFFNASLANVTKDQADLGGGGDKAAALLRYLREAARTTRGLLANLTCLLCAEYGVRRVDVAYGDGDGGDVFEKKKRGCRVLRTYGKVVADAAAGIGRCRKTRT